jgi:hypothetical protein
MGTKDNDIFTILGSEHISLLSCEPQGKRECFTHVVFEPESRVHATNKPDPS